MFGLHNLEASQNYGYYFGDSYSKDYRTLVYRGLHDWVPVVGSFHFEGATASVSQMPVASRELYSSVSNCSGIYQDGGKMELLVQGLGFRV